jgi:iron(III) transport system substrate-binding protein
MRKSLLSRTAVLAISVLVLLGLAACGGDDPAPTSPAAAAPAAAVPRSTPLPTPTPPPAAPSKAAAAPSKAAWEVQWDTVLAAAREEGTVNCTCVPIPFIRDVILEEWAKDYPGIEMEYSFASLPSIEPQITAERAAGKFIRDVYNWSASPEQYVFNDRGFFEKLRPLMILPEVTDESLWRGGFDERFQDDAKETVFGAGASVTTIGVNTKRIAELGLAQPTSALDFLKPEYEGQIVGWDVRFGGGGANVLGWWNFMFGLDAEDGVQALLNTDMLQVSGGSRKVAEQMIQAGKLVGFSAPKETDYRPFREAGVEFNIERFGKGPQHGPLSPGWSPSVFKNAPHPNAATVLLNWMLSKSTHERVFSRIYNNSARLDVPAYDEAGAPIEGAEYFGGQTETGLKTFRIPAMELAREFYR